MAGFALKSGPCFVIGRAGLDLYADPPGTKIEEARAFFPALGGSAANIASAIAILGHAATLITSVSDDPVGHYVTQQLKHYGVSTDEIRFIKGEERTSLAVVETRSDIARAVLYRNRASDFELTPEDIRELDYRHAAALIVTGTSLAQDPSRKASFEAIRLAREASCLVIIDLDYRPYSWASRDEAAALYRDAALRADIVIGNDDEFDVLARDQDGVSMAANLATRHHKVVIYKRGEKGLIAFKQSDRIEMGVYPVKALKSTGAGDAFMGGFVTGLLEGATLHDALQRGAASAAIVVTRVGCSPANPNRIDLIEFMKSHQLADPFH